MNKPNAKPMFALGGTRVLDENNKTIGFVFTESLNDHPGSQLQRWILRGVRGSYRFVEWEMPTAKTWKQMVTTPAPSADDKWGDDPTKGLWVENALYVVAQSTPVVPRPGPAPMPKFPRHVASTHRRPSVPRSQELNIGSLDLPFQIIFGSYDLTQLGKILGCGFGDLQIENYVGQKFFESSEYILTWPEATVAEPGTQGILSLEPGRIPSQDASQFHEYAVANYREGSLYHVVGCNYYQSQDQPPGQDMAAFLFS